MNASQNGQEQEEWFWVPLPHYLNRGEYRILTLWCDGGVYGWAWRGRDEHEGYPSIEAARTAALADASERWPELAPTVNPYE